MPSVIPHNDKKKNGTDVSAGTRRKTFSKLEENYITYRGGCTHNQDLNSERVDHGRAYHHHHHHHHHHQHNLGINQDDSSKRVDLTSTHRLRELNWGDSYQDSLSFPADKPTSGHWSFRDNTLTTSRDIRETDIRFLNFPQPPDTYNLNSNNSNNNNNNNHPTGSNTRVPSSTSQSSAISSVVNTNNISSSDSSPVIVTSPISAPPPSLSNSPAPCSRLVIPSSLSPPAFPDADVRWKNAQPTNPKVKTTNSSKIRTIPKLNHVDIRSVTTGETMPSFPYSALNEPQTSHKFVEDKWAGFRPERTKKESVDKTIGVSGSNETGVGGSNQIPGGVPAAGGFGLDLETSPRVPRPIKKPITDLKDSEIMMKLKERLKQQRTLASNSSVSSNDNSMTESSSVNAPPVPPREPIINTPTTGTGTTTTKPRKVAAGHATPSYKGFSEAVNSTKTLPKPSSANAKKKTAANTNNTSTTKKPQQPLTRKHDSQNEAPGIVVPTANRPKKAARLVAPSDKKSKQPGAKNIITTSSWRSGQELVIRELGPTSVVAKSKHAKVSAAKSEEDGAAPSVKLPSAKDEVDLQTLSLSKNIAEDAKNMLSELNAETPERKQWKPPVKRKATKSVDTEKSQPCEKSRHYDQDSIRKFMAKQKAERIKKQQEDKLASEKALERKKQILTELTKKQKQQAKASVVMKSARTEGVLKRKSEHWDKENKTRRATLEAQEDLTLTEESDESTPQATPHGTPHGTPHDTPRDGGQVETTNSSYPVRRHLDAGSAYISVPPASVTNTQEVPAKLDVGATVTRFSQFLSQKQDPNHHETNTNTEHELNFRLARPEHKPNETGENSVFSVLGMNPLARTNEQRKQAIRATAMTLQSRIIEEKKRLESGSYNNTSQTVKSPEPRSRYSRVVGDPNEHAVFTSDLPGTRIADVRNTSANDQEAAALTIQAAYRGYNVRQAHAWQLPSGQTFGQSLRNTGQSEGNDVDESAVTETSSFSEITNTDPSHSDTVVKTSPHKAVKKQPASRVKDYEEGVKDTWNHKGPAQPAWGEAKADPFSIMSVFSRRSKYLVSEPGNSTGESILISSTITTSTTTATTTTVAGETGFAEVGGLDIPLKEPVVSSQERVVVGQTSSGHSVVAKTKYTRVEASLVNHTDDVPPELPPRVSLTKTRTAREQSRDEDSDGQPSVTRKVTSKKSPVVSYVRQASDTGQETDVSQLSEDEPKKTKKKDSNIGHGDGPSTFNVPTHHGGSTAKHRGEGEGRLSPGALHNKFSANLHYLESMEESLRQVVGMERARGIALAQQESVTLAQILKIREQEHNAELEKLQKQVNQEAIETRQHLDKVRSRSTLPKSLSIASSLLDTEANRRPDSRSPTKSFTRTQDESSRSATHQPSRKSTASTYGSSRFSNSKRDRTLTSKGGKSSVLTAEDSRDSSSKIQSEQQAAADESRDSIAEDIQSIVDEALPNRISQDLVSEDESYSMAFDSSIADEESFRQVLPSESHRRKSGEFSGLGVNSLDASSHITPQGDLSSLFLGEDGFNKFTADTVRQIMREEDYRAQHQAALLSLREKALTEKAKAELSWLEQLKQQPRDKGADDTFPNLEKKEKLIRKNLHEQQAEIRRLQEANNLANRERQRLLQQHQDIAKIKQTTQHTIKKLKGAKAKGRLARPSEVHTEDEVEDPGSDHDVTKDSKSDSEIHKDRTDSPHSQGKHEQHKMKLQKLNLDYKFMTAREQKLHERKKQAQELLEWKKKLDEKEKKVIELERKACRAWEHVTEDKKKGEAEARKEDQAMKKLIKDDSEVISDKVLSSMREELATNKSKIENEKSQSLVSEKITTNASSMSKVKTRTSDEKPRTKSSKTGSGSESSVPEEIPSASSDKQKAQESSDDTIINSSVNEDYADTFEAVTHDTSRTPVSHRRKSPVGKLLPQTNSPLPSPWSRKTGSESESEDSISHTETLSDASDYEIRIRQLSDELRRRRKEVEILKKERSRRQKDKLKAQEESMKKQLDTYTNVINQLKSEKDDLELETGRQSSVPRPQIKNPSGQSRTRTSSKSEDGASNSSSFEDTRDSGDSNQASPCVDSNTVGFKVSPDDKTKKSPASVLGKISEGSESDKSSVSKKSVVEKKSETSNASIQEVIEAKELGSTSYQNKDSDLSYSMDFSESQSIAHSNKIDKNTSGQSEKDIPDQITTDLQLSISERLRKGTEKEASDKSETGIQESDSETESRVNSIRTKSEASSRPSSERSVGSLSYAEEDYDDEDISIGSDKTPVKSQSFLPHVDRSNKEDDSISEHISSSLPSISEKRSASQQLKPESQEILNDLLGIDEEDEKTPVATPREMASSPVDESPDDVEENKSLLMTDPLLDFNLGDRVFVWGKRAGILQYKGKLDNKPGIWAGVELINPDGDSDGSLEGKRYFTCSPNCGLFVPGSEITSIDHESSIKAGEGDISADDSITTEGSNLGEVDDRSIQPAGDSSMLFSTPIGSPICDKHEKPTATPVKEHSSTSRDSSISDRENVHSTANKIVENITDSLVKDSLKTLNDISRKSPEKTQHSSDAPKDFVVSPEIDKLTTDKVMANILQEAITQMVSIKNKKTMTGRREEVGDISWQHVNGNDKSMSSLMQEKFLTKSGSKIDETDKLELERLEGSLDLNSDPIARPGSPLPAPTTSTEARKELDAEIDDLYDFDLGNDDLALSAHTHKPQYSEDTLSSKLPKIIQEVPEEIEPVVAHTKEEVAPIVSRALTHFWQQRRCGELMKSLEPPTDFYTLVDQAEMDRLTRDSRRSRERMLFDMTGEIVRDIYKDESKEEARVWQKVQHASQRYHKGHSPPTTLQDLQPIVESAVFHLLDLNGSRQRNTVNKWSIRKRKDAVDAILVEELGEEERGWVDYSKDELNLKMALSDAIFDSLLTDTVHVLNGVYKTRSRKV